MNSKGTRAQEESSIAKSVMERIRREERWAYSQVEQNITYSKQTLIWVTGIGLAILLTCVYLFINGLSAIKGQEHEDPTQRISAYIGSGDIGYADTSINESFTFSLEGVVASIGESLMVGGRMVEQTVNFPLLISFFVFLQILLLMNWFNRNVDN
jgi:hypothetical protein